MYSLFFKLFGAAFEVIRPFVAPILAYFKGRSDMRKTIELESRKRDDELIDEAVDAGRNVDPSRLRDDYFRD